MVDKGRERKDGLCEEGKQKRKRGHKVERTVYSFEGAVALTWEKRQKPVSSFSFIGIQIIIIQMLKFHNHNHHPTREKRAKSKRSPNLLLYFYFLFFKLFFWLSLVGLCVDSLRNHAFHDFSLYQIGFLNDNKKGGKKRGSWASSQGHGSLVSSWAALGCLRCILLLTTSHGSNPPPLDYYSHIISLSFKFFFFPSLVTDGCPGFSRGLGHVWILRQRNSFYSAFDCSALELLIRNENRNK